MRRSRSFNIRINLCPDYIGCQFLKSPSLFPLRPEVLFKVIVIDFKGVFEFG